jgi:hypothetical protein
VENPSKSDDRSIDQNRGEKGGEKDHHPNGEINHMVHHCSLSPLLVIVNTKRNKAKQSLVRLN